MLPSGCSARAALIQTRKELYSLALRLLHNAGQQLPARTVKEKAKEYTEQFGAALRALDAARAATLAAKAGTLVSAGPDLGLEPSTEDVAAGTAPSAASEPSSTASHKSMLDSRVEVQSHWETLSAWRTCLYELRKNAESDVQEASSTASEVALNKVLTD